MDDRDATVYSYGMNPWIVQGDPYRCSVSVVDIKTKIARLHFIIRSISCHIDVNKTLLGNSVMSHPVQYWSTEHVSKGNSPLLLICTALSSLIRCDVCELTLSIHPYLQMPDLRGRLRGRAGNGSSWGIQVRLSYAVNLIHFDLVYNFILPWFI